MSGHLLDERRLLSSFYRACLLALVNQCADGKLIQWPVKRDGARTVRISLSAPHLPGLTRKNLECD